MQEEANLQIDNVIRNLTEANNAPILIDDVLNSDRFKNLPKQEVSTELVEKYAKQLADLHTSKKQWVWNENDLKNTTTWAYEHNLANTKNPLVPGQTYDLFNCGDSNDALFGWSNNKFYYDTKYVIAHIPDFLLSFVETYFEKLTNYFKKKKEGIWSVIHTTFKVLPFVYCNIMDELDFIYWGRLFYYRVPTTEARDYVLLPQGLFKSSLFINTVFYNTQTKYNYQYQMKEIENFLIDKIMEVYYLNTNLLAYLLKSDGLQTAILGFIKSGKSESDKTTRDRLISYFLEPPLNPINVCKFFKCTLNDVSDLLLYKYKLDVRSLMKDFYLIGGEDVEAMQKPNDNESHYGIFTEYILSNTGKILYQMQHTFEYYDYINTNRVLLATVCIIFNASQNSLYLLLNCIHELKYFKQNPVFDIPKHEALLYDLDRERQTIAYYQKPSTVTLASDYEKKFTFDKSNVGIKQFDPNSIKTSDLLYKPYFNKFSTVDVSTIRTIESGNIQEFNLRSEANESYLWQIEKEISYNKTLYNKK